MELLDSEESSFTEILKSFHDDQVGKLCRTDTTIKLIGSKSWEKEKTKVDKFDEVRKSVMGDMRTIATLYFEFKSRFPGSTNDSIDMFQRQNFDYLKEAIIEMTTKEETPDGVNVKYGLKSTIYYLLVRAAKVLEGEALTRRGSEAEEEAKEMVQFAKIMKHHENSLFGDAKYFINKSRQQRLRLPTRTPAEEDLEKLKNHIESRTKVLMEMQEFQKKEYVELRNLLCCRLTLFNARRGGEPARIKVKEWLERDKWIDQKATEHLSDEEKKLVDMYAVFFLSGKGNHLVSCVIPEDSIAALDRLADECVRKNCGIGIKNSFIFASSKKGSKRHVAGWSATNKVVEQAKIHSSLVNATNQRGRVSTIYAALHVPPEKRDLFYAHMGHSKEVNQGTYQRPHAVTTLLEVAPTLTEIDRGVKRKRGLIFFVSNIVIVFTVLRVAIRDWEGQTMEWDCVKIVLF